MTKQEPVDPSLKCHLDFEEAGKVDLGSVGKMLEKNAFVIRGVETVPNQTLRQRRTFPVGVKPKASKLVKVAKKLHNLDPTCELEKPLKIDLNLYQMEDF